MKKLLNLILILGLSISLIGCSKEEPKQPFDDFVKLIEDTMMDGTTSFQSNFLFNDPVAAGYERPTVYGYGFFSEEENDELYDKFEDFKDEMEKYDYDALSETQKVTYDALYDYLLRNLALEDYYYYESPYIGNYSSVIQELPLLLQMYTFNNKDDLEDYFKNIKAFEEDFKNYASLEKERQEKGLGLSKEILDDTKKQIQGIIDGKGQEIITEVNKIIDGLDFLSAEEKVSYKERNKQAIEADFINAYKTLLDELKDIEGKEKTLGSYYLEDGKDYYEAKVYQQLGINKSIEDIEKELEDSTDEKIKALQIHAMTNQHLLSKEDLYDIKYHEFSNVKGGFDYLKDNIFTMVPKINDLTYDIYIVPSSLQEGFAPAAYLSSKVDKKDGEAEIIMINPKNTNNLLPTLVHEGYPGHMYQNSYLQSLELPLVHYLMDCIGYTEGWAIYVESQASRFIKDKETQAWQQLLMYDSDITSTLFAILDIKIHYYGWDIEDCVDFLNDYLGASLSAEDLKQIYQIIVQTPGYYLYYIYSGQVLTDCRKDAEKQLGNKFDEIEFHKAILNSGPIGLDKVKENVKKYISSNK